MQHDASGHWLACAYGRCTMTDTKQSHVWIQGKVDTAPTYFEDGERINSCTCGKTKTVILPKLVDCIAPTGDIKIGADSVRRVLNTITFGLFFKDTQKVKITYADMESGIKSAQYYLSKEILDENTIKSLSSWVNYTDEI